MSKLKVAIIHDVFDSCGGSELVALTLIEMYPNCDVYSLLIDDVMEAKIKKMKHKIYKSMWQPIFSFLKVTGLKPMIKIFSWIYWLRLDLSKYDLVISSSHSYGSKMVKASDGFHISYIHTPPRYLYMDEYELNFFPFNLFFWSFRPILRFIDKLGSRRPDVLVANSVEVQKRIERYYGRSSVVVYPPVSIGEHMTKNGNREYYICFSRLVRQKGVSLAVRTCSKYGLPLLVVGSGPEEKYLKSIAGKTVRFWGFCREKDKPKVYSQAKALIFPAKDEDFGIVPVEAMSYGVPVVAYFSGGVKETVTEKTGVFFESYKLESLKKALDELENNPKKYLDCVERAKKFDKKIFVDHINKLVIGNLGTKLI